MDSATDSSSVSDAEILDILGIPFGNSFPQPVSVNIRNSNSAPVSGQNVDFEMSATCATLPFIFDELSMISKAEDHSDFSIRRLTHDMPSFGTDSTSPSFQTPLYLNSHELTLTLPSSYETFKVENEISHSLMRDQSASMENDQLGSLLHVLPADLSNELSALEEITYERSCVQDHFLSLCSSPDRIPSFIFDSRIANPEENSFSSSGNTQTSETTDPVSSNELPSSQMSPVKTYPYCSSLTEHSPSGSSPISVSSSKSPGSSENSMKCCVCKNIGARHFNYYGCQGVCTSCRSFFRRSVQTGQFKSFQCKSKTEDFCVIDSKTRKGCKKCRFNRCIGSGMKTKFVMSNEELNQNKNKKMICPTLIMPKLTTEECKFLQHLEQVVYTSLFDKYYALMEVEIDTVKSWIISCTTGHSLTYEIIQKMEYMDGQGLLECANQYLSFENLHREDKNKLIQTNMSKYLAYSWALCYETAFMTDFGTSFVEYGHQNPGKRGVQNVLQVLSELDFLGACALTQYDTVYSSPWAAHEEVEKEHSKLSKIIRRWALPSEDGAPDRIQMIIFEIILLLCADGINMPKDNLKKVEAVQLKYITILHRYLKDKYPKEASSKLAKGLMMLHHVKELYRMHSQRLPI